MAFGAGVDGPGMTQWLVLHSGIPCGDPVKMTLLSDCEKEFQISLSFDAGRHLGLGW